MKFVWFLEQFSSSTILCPHNVNLGWRRKFQAKCVFEFWTEVTNTFTLVDQFINWIYTDLLLFQIDLNVYDYVHWASISYYFFFSLNCLSIDRYILSIYFLFKFFLFFHIDKIKICLQNSRSFILFQFYLYFFPAKKKRISQNLLLDLVVDLNEVYWMPVDRQNLVNIYMFTARIFESLLAKW